MIALFEGGPVNGLMKNMPSDKTEYRIMVDAETDSMDPNVAVYILITKEWNAPLHSMEALFRFSGYRQSAWSLVDFITQLPKE